MKEILSNNNNNNRIMVTIIDIILKKVNLWFLNKIGKNKSNMNQITKLNLIRNQYICNSNMKSNQNQTKITRVNKKTIISILSKMQEKIKRI